MPLTADDIRQASDELSKHAEELDKLAKENGVNVQVAGNDAGELLKASGAGLATGAAIGAAVGAAFPALLPFTTAAGAIIGAIAGFFAKFKTGPSAEQIALADEFNSLNTTIHTILETLPEPYRAELGHTILTTMRASPGPFAFCFSAAEGGCAMTSIQGVRNTAQTIAQQVKDLLARVQQEQDAGGRQIWKRFGLGVALLAGAGAAAWWLKHEGKKR